MRKKILKILVKYLLIAFGVMCFPWIFTIICGKNSNEKIYHTDDSGRSVIVGEKKLDVEDFTACVLMKQMNIREEEEALKAQAVVIRTYIYEKMETEGCKEIDAEKLDLEYILIKDLEKIWGNKFADNYNRLMKIISNTSMKIMVYDGKIIKPYFHSVSCGYTRDGSQVLGDEYVYLKSVQSGKDVESDNYLVGVSVTKAEFAKLIRVAKPEISIADDNPLETLQIISRDAVGYVGMLQIGNVQMTGDEFARIFELNSPNFQVEEYEGDIRIITKGKGHGLGLSMYGSVILAKNGKSYEEILKHYYTGVYLTSLWEN